MSRMTRLDVFLRLPSVSFLSYFVSLEFRLVYSDLPLVWLGFETYLQVRSEFSQTASGLVAKPGPQVSYRGSHTTGPRRQ